MREIVSVHEKRLAEFEELHRKGHASSSEVSATRVELLNARLRLAEAK